ncbi:MAG: PIG-L deacetylase family protein [Vicinamibacterales bacterium]
MPEASDRTDPAGRSLLCIVAHPDDESLACGGLLAWCSAIGVRVSVLCLTRGEHGLGSGSEDLGAVRVSELLGACNALRVSSVTVLDHADGMLPWIDAWQIERDIEDMIAQANPDIVVTFDEDGLYWHPDHIAVHERTTQVVAKLGNRAPALYYAQIPSGAMRAVVAHAELVLAGTGSEAPGSCREILGISDADAFGTHAVGPSLVVDAGEYAARKLAALKSHATQVAGGALSLVTEDEAARLLGREQYRRAPVGRQGRTFVDTLGHAP